MYISMMIAFLLYNILISIFIYPKGKTKALKNFWYIAVISFLIILLLHFVVSKNIFLLLWYIFIMYFVIALPLMLLLDLFLVDTYRMAHKNKFRIVIFLIILVATAFFIIFFKQIHSSISSSIYKYNILIFIPLMFTFLDDLISFLRDKCHSMSKKDSLIDSVFTGIKTFSCLFFITLCNTKFIYNSFNSPSSKLSLYIYIILVFCITILNYFMLYTIVRLIFIMIYYHRKEIRDKYIWVNILKHSFDWNNFL